MAITPGIVKWPEIISGHAVQKRVQLFERKEPKILPASTQWKVSKMNNHSHLHISKIINGNMANEKFVMSHRKWSITISNSRVKCTTEYGQPIVSIRRSERRKNSQNRTELSSNTQVCRRQTSCKSLCAVKMLQETYRLNLHEKLWKRNNHVKQHCLFFPGVSVCIYRASFQDGNEVIHLLKYARMCLKNS